MTSRMRKATDSGSCPQPVSDHLSCRDKAGQGITQKVGPSFLIPCLGPCVILFEIYWDCCHLHSSLSHCSRTEEIYSLGAIFNNDTTVKPIKPGRDGSLGRSSEVQLAGIGSAAPGVLSSVFCSTQGSAGTPAAWALSGKHWDWKLLVASTWLSPARPDPFQIFCCIHPSGCVVSACCCGFNLPDKCLCDQPQPAVVRKSWHSRDLLFNSCFR